MTILPFGDSALLVNFEQVIDINVNRQTIQLAEMLREQDISGITFISPAYCSITIGFDPLVISFQKLLEITTSTAQTTTPGDQLPGRKFMIPVCYEREYALDMTEVCAQTGLTPEAVVALHTSQEYTVFMLGFRPGFVYLGRVPEQLYTRRKQAPRKRIPARAVALAGFQTGVYPAVSPGGWQIIGSTPNVTFDPALDDPFILKAGDRVQFYSVTLDQHQQAFNQGFKLRPENE